MNQVGNIISVPVDYTINPIDYSASTPKKVEPKVGFLPQIETRFGSIPSRQRPSLPG